MTIPYACHAIYNYNNSLKPTHNIVLCKLLIYRDSQISILTLSNAF